MKKIKSITSTQNQIIKDIINLKKNNDYFLVISQNIIEEAIKNNLRPKTLIVLEDKLNTISEKIKNFFDDIILVNKTIINKINPSTKFNYIFALFYKSNHKFKKNFDHENIVLLEKVQNPENVGLIVRTMLGLGYSQILLYECASIYNEKSISASSGYIFNQNVYEIKDLSFLNLYKQRDYEIIATTLKNSIDLKLVCNELVSKKKIIIFGNEGNGITENLLKQSTKLVKIKMNNNVDSFNVAISAAMIGFLLIK